MASFNNTFVEGRSNIIPSIFDGTDFLNWKLETENGILFKIC